MYLRQINVFSLFLALRRGPHTRCQRRHWRPAEKPEKITWSSSTNVVSHR